MLNSKPYLRLWVLGLLLFVFDSGASAQLEDQPPESIPIIEAQSKDHRPDQALKVEAVYIVDLLSNVRGGVERGTKTLGNLNLVADWDPWEHGNFHFFLQGNHGGSFTDLVGDFQVVSHIEAQSTVNLFEAHYQHRFFEDKLSVLAGLYAVDSEFDTRSSSALFVHSSPGTGGDLGQVGVNGPGIFPIGALGVRLKYEDAGWYGQCAVTEGIPGNPHDPFGTHLSFDKGEGVFVIGEAGHIWSDEQGELGKVGLGAWGFSRGYETFLDPQARTTNRGAYLTLEKAFHREQEEANQGLAGYLRVGVADGRINPIENFVGVGLVYTGPFEGRDQDRLGFALNTGFVGDDYLESGDFDTHETALELTYQFKLNDNFYLQPDLQYIINPGFDPALKDSFVVGLRAVLVLSN
jgi:porin